MTQPTATIIELDSGKAAPEQEQTCKSPVLPLVISELCYEANQQRLLKYVSCTLTAGNSTIILGPNGAGKSLLLRICQGLIAPASGNISWSGLNPVQARPYVAMVFQKPVLLRRSTAANIDYALAARGVPRKQRRERVTEALELTNLNHLARRSARVLSGGEQQRLAIARAWVTQPEVLLMDEPTSKLDPGASYAVEQLISAIRKQGTKVIMTTHDMGQAQRLGDEVLFLNRGRLLEQTPAKIFFERPQSKQAAAFISGELLY